MPRTTKPAETIDPATPDVTMGQRPDGSPWAIHADFGYGVSVSGVWGLMSVSKRSEISLDEARGRAAALLAATEWVETGQSEKLEAEARREEAM